MIDLYAGAERPVTQITWMDNGQLLDLSQFTFQLKLVNCRNVRQQLTKTTNIYGYRDTRPNVGIEWQTSAELSTLDPGWYTLQLRATNPRTNTDRYYRDVLLLKSVI